MKKYLCLIAVLLVAAAVPACTPEQEGASPVVVGSGPADVRFVEQDSYNVPYWLQGGASDRLLVRLSAYDGMAPVDDESMAKIKALTRDGGPDGLVRAGDMLAENRLFDASSMVYVAHRLGIVREVVWVVPIFLSVDQEYLDSLKGFLTQRYPESGEEIKALTLEGVQATGRINGVPVRLTGLQDLKDPGSPVLLDLDASFFEALYIDEKETGSLPFVAGSFKFLREAGLRSDLVSISASGEDQRAGLKFRSFARYFERMLKEPGLIDDEPPELWSERAAAWRMEQSDPETAIPLYKRLIEQNPEDAASRYDLAELYFRLGELEGCAVNLEAAAKIDHGYAAAYGIYRDRLAEMGEPAAAAMFFARRPEGVR